MITTKETQGLAASASRSQALRARADECQKEIVTHPDARSSYVRLTASYDLLADQESNSRRCEAMPLGGWTLRFVT
jgi:hypothetical protein